MRIGYSPLSPKDIVAHFIPGALLLGLALWFLDGFAGIVINLLTLGNGAVSLVMWLAAAYVAGVFIHVFRRFLIGRHRDQLETALATQLLAEADSHFSPEFKRELAARSGRLFGHAAGEELFQLCLNYNAQHRAAGRAESLAAFGDMYKGLLATVRVGAAVSLLIAIKQVILLLLPQLNMIVPVTGFLEYEAVQLAVAIILLIVFGLSVQVLRKTTEAYARETVAEVYTGFLALTGDGRDGSSK